MPPSAPTRRPQRRRRWLQPSARPASAAAERFSSSVLLLPLRCACQPSGLRYSPLAHPIPSPYSTFRHVPAALPYMMCDCPMSRQLLHSLLHSFPALLPLSLLITRIAHLPFAVARALPARGAVGPPGTPAALHCNQAATVPSSRGARGGGALQLGVQPGPGLSRWGIRACVRPQSRHQAAGQAPPLGQVPAACICGCGRRAASSVARPCRA